MTQAEPRVWLITGADKGLGANMARTALMAGDRVFVTVLDKDGKPYGIITRSDIIGAYKLALQIRREELEEEDG